MVPNLQYYVGFRCDMIVFLPDILFLCSSTGTYRFQSRIQACDKSRVINIPGVFFLIYFILLPFCECCGSDPDPTFHFDAYPDLVPHCHQNSADLYADPTPSFQQVGKLGMFGNCSSQLPHLIEELPQ